jgi:hypothetical protein
MACSSSGENSGGDGGGDSDGSSEGSGGGDNSLKGRLGDAIRGELELQGDDLHETYETGNVTGPTEVANKDHLLGPNQVRYNVDMHNPVNGTTTNYSVNYDPTTGEFGSIHESSGRK